MSKVYVTLGKLLDYQRQLTGKKPYLVLLSEYYHGAISKAEFERQLKQI